jgi:hypothetical protein
VAVDLVGAGGAEQGGGATPTAAAFEARWVVTVRAGQGAGTAAGRRFAVAVAAVGLSIGVVAATGTSSAGAPGDDGLAQSFVAAGRCDGGPGFRVDFHNETTEEGPVVTADLRLKRAGERARWDFTSAATTTFTDGTTVTLVGDFGRARSTRNGVVEISTSTPAGVRHSVGFGLTRRGDGATCTVRVRG